MSDKITIYYYTAWDGFAWQGCDEATARSLQGYMEATKTLPKSSSDEPPFGGAVPCKIKGEIGVAVYRYLTRMKGDLSGRDSLYIALAFVPLNVGPVDFVKLLDLPQLSVPNPGELRPEEMSVSELGLQLTKQEEEPEGWLDSDSAAEKYCVLGGLDGLRKLSALFFSKYTQLGFLNAVFQSENGIDGVVSTQTYRVYPEVVNVVIASKALREARRNNGGILDKGNAVVQKMNEALDELEEWYERQRGYAGLRDYHAEKKQELNDDSEKIKRISAYAAELEELLGKLPDEDSVRRNGLDVDGENLALQCEKNAKKIDGLPVLDHESYKAALKCAMECIHRSSRLMGASEYSRRAVKLESELKTCRQEAEVKGSNDKNKIEKLKNEIEELKKHEEELTRQLDVLGNRLREGEMKHGLSGKCSLNSVRPHKKCVSFGMLKWVLMIVVALFLSCTTIVFVKKLAFNNGDGNRKGGHHVRSGWSRCIEGTPISSNAVPAQAKDVKEPIVEQPASNVADRVRIDKSGEGVRHEASLGLKGRGSNVRRDDKDKKQAKIEEEGME